MAFGPNPRTVGRADVRTADIDVGLRKYMLGVYNYMALGVAFTGIVALVVAMQPAFMEAVFGSHLKWVFFGGILLSGFVAPRIIMTGSTPIAHLVFWLYAAMWGVLIAPYLIYYTEASVIRTFFITAAAFAGMSLYGYTTKRDLTAMGAFLCMSTFGILFAILLNVFFVQSSMLHLGLTILVPVIFAGLTAYETQMIKQLYYEGDGSEVQTRKSIFGAFFLYGSFVTMFIWLLQLFGVARE